MVCRHGRDREVPAVRRKAGHEPVLAPCLSSPYSDGRTEAPAMYSRRAAELGLHALPRARTEAADCPAPKAEELSPQRS